jgi:hypothetical protein
MAKKQKAAADSVRATFQDELNKHGYAFQHKLISEIGRQPDVP